MSATPGRTVDRLVTLTGAGTLVALSALLTLAACSKRAAPVTAARPAVDSVQVGYGGQPRDKAIGAMTTLDGTAPRPLSVEQLLRGKVAGLEVIQNGSNVTFRIRGGITGVDPKVGGTSIEPLVIIDDAMMQPGNIANALAGLTPDDIKQVNVLKDLASTSVYGGRGAGGVIIITTKRKQQN